MAFLTLIPRSSLLTWLFHSMYVFVMQGGDISPQQCEVRGHVHTRTNHLISKRTQICFGMVIKRQSNRGWIPDLCLRPNEPQAAQLQKKTSAHAAISQNTADHGGAGSRGSKIVSSQKRLLDAILYRVILSVLFTPSFSGTIMILKQLTL